MRSQQPRALGFGRCAQFCVRGVVYDFQPRRMNLGRPRIRPPVRRSELQERGRNGQFFHERVALIWHRDRHVSFAFCRGRPGVVPAHHAPEVVQNSLQCSQLFGSVFTNFEHHLFSESQWRHRRAQSTQIGRSGFTAAGAADGMDATRSREAHVPILFGNSKNFSLWNRHFPRVFCSNQ